MILGVRRVGTGEVGVGGIGIILGIVPGPVASSTRGARSTLGLEGISDNLEEGMKSLGRGVLKVSESDRCSRCGCCCFGTEK